MLNDIAIACLPSCWKNGYNPSPYTFPETYHHYLPTHVGPKANLLYSGDPRFSVLSFGSTLGYNGEYREGYIDLNLDQEVAEAKTDFSILRHPSVNLDNDTYFHIDVWFNLDKAPYYNPYRAFFLSGLVEPYQAQGFFTSAGASYYYNHPDRQGAVEFYMYAITDPLRYYQTLVRRPDGYAPSTGLHHIIFTKNGRKLEAWLDGVKCTVAIYPEYEIDYDFGEITIRGTSTWGQDIGTHPQSPKIYAYTIRTGEAMTNERAQLLYAAGPDLGGLAGIDNGDGTLSLVETLVDDVSLIGFNAAIDDVSLIGFNSLVDDVSLIGFNSLVDDVSLIGYDNTTVELSAAPSFELYTSPYYDVKSGGIPNWRGGWQRMPNQWLRKCKGQDYSNERKLFRKLQTEAYNRHGVCLVYYMVTYDKLYDRIWGEDGDRRWVRKFEVMGFFGLQKEEKLWSKFAIEGVDNFSVYVSKEHFRKASTFGHELVSGNIGENTYPSVAPREGDVLISKYNNYAYEIVSVKEQSALYHLSREYSWEFIVSPLKDEHIRHQSDTSASINDDSPISAFSLPDILGISDDVSQAVSAFSYDPPADEPDPRDPYGGW